MLNQLIISKARKYIVIQAQRCYVEYCYKLSSSEENEIFLHMPRN